MYYVMLNLNIYEFTSSFWVFYFWDKTTTFLSIQNRDIVRFSSR